MPAGCGALADPNLGAANRWRSPEPVAVAIPLAAGPNEELTWLGIRSVGEITCPGRWGRFAAGAALRPLPAAA